MSVENRAAVAEPGERATATGGWVTLVDGAAAGQRTRPPTAGRVVGRFVVANLIAVTLLMAGSVWASGMAAKDEAISEARTPPTCSPCCWSSPSLDERLPAGDPAAVAALDAVIRDRMQAADVIRVKIWTPDGGSSTPTSPG